LNKLKYKSPWTNDTDKITPLLANLKYEDLKFPNEKDDEIAYRSKGKDADTKEKLNLCDFYRRFR